MFEVFQNDIFRVLQVFFTKAQVQGLVGEINVCVCLGINIDCFNVSRQLNSAWLMRSGQINDSFNVLRLGQ